MNIPAISGLKFSTPFFEKQQPQKSSNYGLVMALPLLKDTVSFKATPKMLLSRSYGVSLDTARKVHREAEPMQKKAEGFLINLLGDLKATDMNPLNIIAEIKGRIKTPVSIAEKSATRQLNCKSEILEFMTDLNGTKIVMRDANKKQVDVVLKRLKQAIQKGDIDLIEIENKRPAIVRGAKLKRREQYDYASSEALEDLVHTQEAKWREIYSLKNRPLVKYEPNDYTEMNYPAIHFLMKLPGEKRAFELMLMGKDVAALKDLDDLLFKILNNKNVNKKYKKIADLVKPLNDPGNKTQLEKFNKYRSEAFIFQREKEPTAYSEKNIVYFLPLKYDIAPEFDLNNLYRLMQECNKKS